VAESLRISEIRCHPAAPNTEYVELCNVGAETIDLNLVRFADGVNFVFPAVGLEPGGRCLVVQDREAFEAMYGATLPCVGRYTGSLNNSGERIELQDAAGRSIQAFSYRDDWHDITDGAGFSLTVRDLGTGDPNAWNDAGAWRPSAAVGGSPGADDAGNVTDVGAVVINELLANATGGTGDWIELYNTTDQTVNLGGWYLSDDADDPAKYEIAGGTTIVPHGYVVLDEDQHFGNTSDPGCHTAFALSQNGEAIYLYSASEGMLTGYSDRVEFGASEPGVTFGRYLLSTGAFDFVSMSEPTPGALNADPRTGPLVISEIMYHPDDPADAEYIELLNISDANLVLCDVDSGVPWRLADDTDNPGVEVLFPADPPITLAPGQYLLLVKDRLLCDARYFIPDSLDILEWGLGRLDNAGETITLSRPGQLDEQGVQHWICVDRVTFSDGAHPQEFPGGVDPWPVEAAGQGLSLTRMLWDRHGNDPDNWQAGVPSPGTAKRRGGR
jgi:hypothetical protein